jgi:hypothetical protein
MSLSNPKLPCVPYDNGRQAQGGMGWRRQAESRMPSVTSVPPPGSGTQASPQLLILPIAWPEIPRPSLVLTTQVSVMREEVRKQPGRISATAAKPPRLPPTADMEQDASQVPGSLGRESPTSAAGVACR